MVLYSSTITMMHGPINLRLLDYISKKLLHSYAGGEFKHIVMDVPVIFGECLGFDARKPTNSQRRICLRLRLKTERENLLFLRLNQYRHSGSVTLLLPQQRKKCQKSKLFSREVYKITNIVDLLQYLRLHMTLLLAGVRNCWFLKNDSAPWR